MAIFSKVCCKWSCGLIGLVLLVIGCVLIPVFDNLVHKKVDNALPLKNGSDSYQNWMSPPAPIYFQIWVQDVVNPEEVMQRGEKPVLLEKGPYTYREERQKVDITYEANNTISYREKRWYYFDRSKSYGPESDNFTTVNLPMITLADFGRFLPPWMQTILNGILEVTGEHVFIKLSVAQLMWGYEDSLLKDVKDALGLNISDKFGLFYEKNGTDDGLYRIVSGIDGSVDEIGKIVSWNNNSSLSYWTSDSANSINGSDGTIYPPFVDTSESKYLFSSDLCRSLEIHYSNSYELKGIDLDRFVVPPYNFANASVNPSNEGFCTPEHNCLPAGLLNASVCRQGAPVIFSLPHFLDGDDGIRNRVIGMNPNRDEHQSVIDIEPTTGVVMNVAKRLQINAFLTNVSHILDTVMFHQYVVLPILWLNESATVDDKSASDFKNKVQMVLKLTKVVQYALIAVGAVILLCIIIIIVKGILSKPKDKELGVQEETTSLLS